QSGLRGGGTTTEREAARAHTDSVDFPHLAGHHCRRCTCLVIPIQSESALGLLARCTVSKSAYGADRAGIESEKHIQGVHLLPGNGPRAQWRFHHKLEPQGEDRERL